ncbi:MAG: DUF1772 domain-containing protein [Ferruginibacter sp.]|nr:DUF1772 domain-containing protein [Cytophagales bacterium]
MKDALLGGTATTTALIAGLFYAYSCSVNPGLNRLSDTAYLTAMQSINRAILNPVFFAVFSGAALLLPLSTYVHFAQPAPERFWFLLAATIVYLVGAVGVTIVGNVPLNEILDAFNLQSASVSEIAAQRIAFEVPWNRLHTVRTIASTLAIILVITACLRSTAD